MHHLVHSDIYNSYGNPMAFRFGDDMRWIFMHFHTPKKGFPEMVVPPNGWCIMEKPIKMDDLVVPP